MSQYVMCKRANETIFLNLEATDTFRSVKEKIGAITTNSADDMRLIAPDETTVYEDEGTIGDRELEEGATIFWVMKQENGDFEEIAVDNGNKEQQAKEAKS